MPSSGPKYLSIVFICSSLQPGKDGVGDYTRRLSAALIKAGHSCAIVSLNDRDATVDIEESQQAEGINIPVLRLPAFLEMKQRMARAKAWISAFDPQWISLQFVPFGYHPKGLKIGLGVLLSSLNNTANWHVMFHELWVGMADEESPKLKLWGRGQRVLIRSLLKKLQPKMVNTQTHLYQQLLGKMDVEAAYLPLFANIPVVAATRANRLTEGIALVVFGAIHDRAPITQFAAEAAAYSKQSGRQVTLTILGRGNSEQHRWANAFKSEGLPAVILGEQSAEHISTILSGATFGLSATALAVIEKSGSYAAMREHGLPVLSVAKKWTPTGVALPAAPAGVLEYRPGNFETCVAAGRNDAYPNNVFQVADIFVKALLST
ncbi:hypothetical protein A0256_22835 [Mucilaginibacter sp. PAMC 26640]|nr:hypothetical protein A0256_22835 [Mucilaginibacter sp. PAMC 26640]